MNWNYRQPVEILFETGGMEQLAALLRMRGYRRGILVCDPFFVGSGLAAQIQERADGRLVGVYSDVTPNPRIREVDACAALLRESGADFAVAVGGGSSIDCAKAACAVAAAQLPAAAYHTGGQALPSSPLPLIAAPTTAGTGSEVTSVAVLTDDEKGVKAPLGGPMLFPKLALVDPNLTRSLPPRATASCGLDALSHALEAFWSRGHQPVCDALAHYAARLVFDWLPAAVENGDDMQARAKMCEASVIAGLSFALPKTAAAHAISFPLTNVWGIPHGEACAFTLGALCRVNAGAEKGRLDRFARELGFPDAAAMGDRIDAMKRDFGLRRTLDEAGIKLADLERLAQLSEHPNLHNNPVELDQNALVALFRKLR